MYIFTAKYTNTKTNKVRVRTFELNQKLFNEFDAYIEAMRIAFIMKRDEELFDYLEFDDKDEV